MTLQALVDPQEIPLGRYALASRSSTLTSLYSTIIINSDLFELAYTFKNKVNQLFNDFISNFRSRGKKSRTENVKTDVIERSSFEDSVLRKGAPGSDQGYINRSSMSRGIVGIKRKQENHKVDFN